MKITIIGAGIGGLCTALALRKYGHEITIYERVREVKPVGAALSLWSNGVKCANYLGVGQQVADLGGQMNSMAYMDGLTGDCMTGFSLQPLMEQVGQRPYPVARADLQIMLMHEFGMDNIHLGMNLTSIEDDGDQVTGYFEDGTEVVSDLLIGSDGAHSVARKYVLGEELERRYSGYVNWNGLVKAEDTLAPLEQWTTYVGEGKRVSLMPVADDRFYFFFDVPLEKGLNTERSEYKTVLKEYFNGWAAPVQKLIDDLDPGTTNRVEIHDIEPFMTWAKGRVALLGDSAHNTSPDLGQGACMAMEDAVVLSWCFAAHDISIEEALKRYEDLRTERCRDLVLRARKRSDITHEKDPAETQSWYDELRQESGEGIIKGIASNILGGPFG